MLKFDICKNCEEKIGIVQPYQVYSYLQCTSMMLEMEVIQTNKIIKNMKLYSYRAQDVHFLSENWKTLYLNNVADIFYEHKQKISAKFEIMLKAVDVYSTLKTYLEYKIVQWYEIESDDYTTDSDNSISFHIISSRNRYSGSCLYHQGEWHNRITFMEKTELLIARIKSLCVALIKSNLTLYIILYFTLKDYCERVRLFLHESTRSTVAQQERLLRDDYHKYLLKHLFKHLLECINKEQEYLARYTDLKLKI